MIGGSIVSSPEDGLDKLAKQARVVLVLLAAVQLVGGGILFLAGGIPDASAIAGTFGLGVVFGALALWARKDPLNAVLVGLGIWVVLVAASAALDSSSLFNGLLVKAIVVALFISGISTGLTYNKLKPTIAPKS